MNFSLTTGMQRR